MGTGWPLRWLENQLLGRYLHGTGIEIGALWRRFPAPQNAHVWYLDRSGPDGLAQHYPEVNGKIIRPDLVADVAQLPFVPASLNFIIASHVLEHMPFPLHSLRIWYEALAPGGVLLLKVPDKRYTFDSRRPRTRLAHLLEEYDHPELFNWRSHYLEFVQYVHSHHPHEPELSQGAADLQSSKLSIHYHAWTDKDLREILDYTCDVWGFNWQRTILWNAHFYRKESVALLVRQ